MKTTTRCFIVFLFSLFLWVSCKKNEIEIKPIKKDIEELVFAPGELQWENEYNIIAQTEGVIGVLYAKEGLEVIDNQEIGRIRNLTSVNNINSAKKQLEIANQIASQKSPILAELERKIQIAKIKYNQDKIQTERYQRLYEKESVSRIEYENILLAAENSFADLQSLNEKYKQAKLETKSQLISSENSLSNSKVIGGYNSIVAWKKGKIIKQLKDVGDFVRPGEVIAKIGDQSQVKAVINVDENSMGKIKLNQWVFIKLNTNKNKIYKGRISEILPSFDIQTQSFICKISFDEPLDFSLSGTKLEANILIGNKKNALLIPRNYLGYGDKVLVKENDMPIKVKTGIISTDWVEILEGLSMNDVLIEPK
jgi:multidrug efflux pump subunit AcrA (membrane-fusion protein)